MKKIPDLTEERREQILSAALQEFAAKGYLQASTNTICREAGVSKGLLFHYFDSKKGLYLYILDRCISYYQQSFDRLMSDLTGDILERIFQITELKMKMFAENPLSYSIVMEAFLDIPPELSDEIKQRHDNLNNKYLPKVYSGLDLGVFREGIDHQRAMELISLVTDGLSDRFIKESKINKDRSVDNLRKYCSLLYEYMDLLKKGIYREENQ